MLAILCFLMFDDHNFRTCMRTLRAKKLLEERDAIFEWRSTTRGDIEYLNEQTLTSATIRIAKINKYLESDTFPMGRVYRLDNGYGGLKFATTTEELAIEGDIRRKF
jgi:hypothetical protein